MSKPAMREDDIRPKAVLDEFFARLKRDADRLACKCGQFVDRACAFCGGSGRHTFDKAGFCYCSCGECGVAVREPTAGRQAPRGVPRDIGSRRGFLQEHQISTHVQCLMRRID